MGSKREVMDAIRARILSGGYERGQRLPSNAELSSEFDVSNNTALWAMRGLADEGYVDVKQGAGSFVAEPITRDGRAEQRAISAALRDEAARLLDLANRLDRMKADD